MRRRERRIRRFVVPAAAGLAVFLSSTPAMALVAAPVPGPGSLALLAAGAGVVALVAFLRRK